VRSWIIAVALAFAASESIAQTAASPYQGQQDRDIKALSAEDIQSLARGEGMGLAKAAELNGYPGPAHVLALSEQLGLSKQQNAETQAIFATMNSRAKQLGQSIIEAEQKLDRSFAQHTVSDGELASLLEGIGSLQTQLRLTHLEAHLALTKVLTADQARKYAELRGYSGEGHGSGHMH
jgi:hypothetical protein